MNSAHWSSGHLYVAKEMDRSKFDYHGSDDFVLDPANSYRYRIFNCLIIFVTPALITAIAQVWAVTFQVVSFVFSIVIITKDNLLFDYKIERRSKIQLVHRVTGALTAISSLLNFTTCTEEVQ